jgi:hypothetical protein
MSDQTVKPKKAFYKKWWFWVLVVIVLGIIGSMGAKNAPPTVLPAAAPTNTNAGTPAAAAPTPAPAKATAIIVSPSALYSAYDKNELSADNQYKNKVVQLTGIIDTIGKDIMGTPYVTLKTNDPIGTIQCMLSDNASITQASAMSPGQTVTMQGTVSSKGITNVGVNDCIFVK